MRFVFCFNPLYSRWSNPTRLMGRILIGSSRVSIRSIRGGRIRQFILLLNMSLTTFVSIRSIRGGRIRPFSVLVNGERFAFQSALFAVVESDFGTTPYGRTGVALFQSALFAVVESDPRAVAR